jgi:hypothetical protein
MSIRRSQDERIEGTPDGVNAITAISDVPNVPTIGTATISGTTASISFTPATIGGTVTTYTATSTPGSLTGTSATSPVSVSGLTVGTSYTFTVRGENSTGTSVESSASNSVTAFQLAGYMVGGNNGGTYYNNIRKMPTSTETYSNLTTLTRQALSPSPLSNSGTAGYIAGAYDGSLYDNIDKLNQITDGKSTIAATLTSGMFLGAGMSNEGTAGYVCGGSTSVGGTNRIDKLAFSNEAKSTLAATMSTSDGYIMTHNVNNKGVASYTIVRDTTNALKLSYSTETTSVLSGFRSNVAYGVLGSSNEGTAGYFTGGFEADAGLRYPSSSDKITFSTETRTTINNTITDDGIGGQRHGGYYNTASFGVKGASSYHCGGYREAYLDLIDKLPYSTETKVSLGSGRLVVAGIANGAGFANQGTI